MCLKREPNTCHWCGSTQGPHPWSVCPAKWRTCTRCGGNDHFARVCLKPTTTSRSVKGTLPKGRVQGRGRNLQRRQDQRRPMYYSLENTNLQQQRLLPPQQYADDQHHELETQHEYYVYDCQFDPVPIYCVTPETSMPKQIGTRQGGRYFVTLHISAANYKFRHAKFQIDTAATCINISERTVKQLSPTIHLTKSPILNRQFFYFPTVTANQ